MRQPHPALSTPLAKLLRNSHSVRVICLRRSLRSGDIQPSSSSVYWSFHCSFKSFSDPPHFTTSQWPSLAMQVLQIVLSEVGKPRPRADMDRSSHAPPAALPQVPLRMGQGVLAPRRDRALGGVDGPGHRGDPAPPMGWQPPGRTFCALKILGQQASCPLR